VCPGHESDSRRNTFNNLVPPEVASPTGVVPEWQRAIDGEIAAVGGAVRIPRIVITSSTPS
jgi:hypothetical protein